MTILSVNDASRMAGVTQHILNGQIENGELTLTPNGIELGELIRVYPKLKPLANMKLRKVKRDIPRAGKTSSGTALTVVDLSLDKTPASASVAAKKLKPAQTSMADNTDSKQQASAATNQAGSVERDSSADEADTVQLLVRELEWNKELLEQTNRQMAKQLAEQQAMIADQARRLDEKDRFWARQVEIAQSLLPAPAPKQRKKLFGIF